MSNIFTWTKLACAAAASAISYVFGGMDTLLGVLLIMAVIDYLTGVSAAVVKKNLSSKTGFYGILKKIAVLCVIACANLLGASLGIEQIRDAVIGFYIANEGISILENAAALGVPLPKKLTDILKQLKSKEEEDDDIQL